MKFFNIMLKNWVKIFLVISMIMWDLPGLAQGGQSPYTFLGLGQIRAPGLLNNFSMGGIGISNSSRFFLNTINPALLTQNNLNTFDMSLGVELRELETEIRSESNASGELSYITLGIPIKPGRWTLAVGLRPLSSVNYDIVTRDSLTAEQVPIGTNFVGEGGLSEFYISNGFKVFKNLSLGIKAAYRFGPIENETIITIDNNLNNQTALVNRTSHSDLAFGVGLHYGWQFKPKSILNVGVIYDFPTSIQAKRSQFQEIRVLGSLVASRDTLIFEEKRKIDVPARLGVGFSYQKSGKWTVGVDLTTQNWSKYEDFEGTSDLLDNSYKIALGGEWIPNISSVSSYLARITYRMGASYERTPFLLNNQNINEIGINFGFSFPVIRFSTINLGAEVGQRGSTSNGLIKERFMRIMFGISFNDLPWRKRPIYD